MSRKVHAPFWSSGKRSDPLIDCNRILCPGLPISGRPAMRSRHGVAIVQFDQKTNKEETHRSAARPLCAYVLTPPLGRSSE